MTDNITLTVEPRELIGKKVKNLRKQGKIPAVVYGHNYKSRAVMVDAVDARKVWKAAGRHHIIELHVDDAKKSAMIKSADFDPVKQRIRHLSLQVVKSNEKVTTEVPLRIANEGSTAAEKSGLVILKSVETIEITALPKDLPDFLEVASDKLVAAGDHVTVADITEPKGVTIDVEAGVAVASVFEPSKMVAAEAEEGPTAEAEEAVENNQ